MTEETEELSAKSSDRKNRRKLGKGLGALMGEMRREEPVGQDSDGEDAEASGSGGGAGVPSAPFRNISVALIDPLPGNPRKNFDEKALDELAASIAARGVIQPIIVRTISGGRYQLVAGERRWRAAQRARLHEIPSLVRELSDREVTALALIENLQREDLNPVEEARAYGRLAEQDGMTQSEIAKMVEKSRSHVANIQRLLSLPGSVLDLVEGGALSMGHARALIGYENAPELAQIAVKDALSVREVEKRVRKNAGGPSSPASGSKAGRDQTLDVQAVPNADIEAVQRQLEEFLGLEVRIQADADPSTGSIAIRYKTLDQLDLVCQRLTGGEI